MIADVEKKLKIEYKRASYKDEVIRKITHLKRQKEIAESYIDYHTEMLSVIEKTDKEIREVFD